MNRGQLAHAVRSARVITAGQCEFVVVGSQAVLAHIASDGHEGSPLFVSMEVDLLPLTADLSVEESLADVVGVLLGDSTPFHQSFDFQVDGVQRSSLVLADGWESRVVDVVIDGEVLDGVHALSLPDLVVSKAYAGREKDWAYIRELVKFHVPVLDQVRPLLESLPQDPFRDRALAIWSSVGARWIAPPDRVSVLESRGNKGP